jgi:hypothetical protein
MSNVSARLAMNATLHATLVAMHAALHATLVAALDSKERLSDITRERREFDHARRRGHRGRFRNRLKAQEQRRSNRQS